MKSEFAKRLAAAHKELGDALSEADMHEQARHHQSQWEHYKAEHERLKAKEEADEKARAEHAAKSAED